MADATHVEMLKKGTEAWNSWRKSKSLTRPDFSGADLSELTILGASLNNADFRGCNLDRTVLRQAQFIGADLSFATFRQSSLVEVRLDNSRLISADLSGATASAANFHNSNLTNANLRGAAIGQANFDYAVMNRADLSNVGANRASFYCTQLVESNLRDSDLSFANLALANLRNADLTNADLRVVNLVQTQLDSANITGAHVYGISAWDPNLTNAVQRDLIISNPPQPKITVDNLEVAQFIYLLINNERIRSILDTVASKMVLILGRFTEERKIVLDIVRDELRSRNYVPVLFDFEGPDSMDTTGTILLLARMARFIIADLTEPRSIAHELASIVQSTVVVIQPLLLKGDSTYAMFSDLSHGRYYVLPIYEYEDVEDLVANLGAKVIAPTEECVSRLRSAQ